MIAGTAQALDEGSRLGAPAEQHQGLRRRIEEAPVAAVRVAGRKRIQRPIPVILGRLRPSDGGRNAARLHLGLRNSRPNSNVVAKFPEEGITHLERTRNGLPRIGPAIRQARLRFHPPGMDESPLESLGGRLSHHQTFELFAHLVEALLQAVLEAGGDVPHYCYHPGLSIVASSLGLFLTAYVLQGIGAVAVLIFVVIFRDEIRRALGHASPLRWWRGR